MKKVLILHGWHGSDLPHWQAWLAQELVIKNCMVAFPQLSDNETPQKVIWIEEALDAIVAFKPDIVICHSLGNILWFHLCESLQTRVKKLLLVAPPRDHIDTPEISTFFPSPVPGDLCSEETLMVVSDNDPYMGIEESISLAFKLGVELKIMENAGHISSSSNFGPWPWVKEWVLQ